MVTATAQRAGLRGWDLNDFLLSAEDDVVASVGRSEVQGLGTTPAVPA
jgi:hypothetical protein